MKYDFDKIIDRSGSGERVCQKSKQHAPFYSN